MCSSDLFPSHDICGDYGGVLNVYELNVTQELSVSSLSHVIYVNLTIRSLSAHVKDQMKDL